MEANMGVNDIVLETSIIPADHQREILGYLLKDREVMGRFSDVVRDENFENPIHRIFYRLARTHFINYHSLPSREVLEREIATWIHAESSRSPVPPQMFWAELTRILGIDVSDRHYILDKVTTYLVKAKLASLVEKAVEAAGSEIPRLDVVNGAINDYFKLVAGNSQQHGEFLLADVESRIREDRAFQKIPTGLPTFDRYLGGGLDAGELGVVLAPTGWGKSFWLITVGANALRQRKRVLHVTLELSRKKVIARYESHYTRLTRGEIVERSDFVTAQILRIRRILSPSDVHILHYPTKGLSIDELRGIILQLVSARDFRPDLIIIDYADLFRPTKIDMSERKYEMLQNLYERLRGLAQELEVPIWTGSQANKASLSRPIITVADIAESFGKAQVSDVVVAICITREEEEDGRARLYLAKNRDNPGHVVIPVRRNFDISRFEEAEGTEALVRPLRDDEEFSDSNNEGEDDVPF
jgi:replicative DNA helicase